MVAEKPTQESLAYDKPLNWDLQDFAIRNDKYIPLGTAFAISDHELVTAAHVLNLTPGSQVYKTRFIREKRKEGGKSDEHVYEVDNIRAFSENRDYVIFSVKGKTFDKWLDVAHTFSFNTKIFTAGDAYGEGIVIREGVLLDETPESENGAWKYLKSSTATNPGSSGGPLLNEKGEVIGIVLMHKDDFCYSLPMKEITPGKALIHRRYTLGFSIFNKRKVAVLDSAWDLPMPYRGLADKYSAAFHDFYNDGMDKLLSESSQDLFPDGPNSEKALFDSVDEIFPQIFLQDSTNGSWFSTNLKMDVTNIDNDGFISSAEIYKDAGVWLLRLRKPRTTSVRELWDNPKMAMDVVLKGINITRKLTETDQGSRVISYGKPVTTVAFSDRYGRLWQINVYFLEYSDQFVMTCATPTPQGLSMIYVAKSSAYSDAWLYDMKKIADFMNVSYFGTLEEWDQFLKQDDFRFGATRNISLSYKEHAYVDITTTSVFTRIREGVIGITKDSDLFLGCTVFLKDGKPVCDIRKLTIDTDSVNYNNYLTFYRWTKPTGSLPEDVKDQWKKMVLEHGHPYNGMVYTENGSTNIGMLHPDFVISDKVTIKKDFAYTLFASKEGTVSEADMKAFLQDFANGTHIKN